MERGLMPDETDEPMIVVRGSLRDEHKRVTRIRIRRAARICFERAEVSAVSLEDVAREAGIGRATLYVYYASKSALLLDLIEQSFRATDRIYLRLAKLTQLSFETVRGWLQSYVDEVRQYSSQLPLIQNASAFGGPVAALAINHRGRAISSLGRRYPAFDLDASTGADRARRKCKAEFMIILIEQYCGAACGPEPSLDPDIAIDVLTERLLAMLMEATVIIPGA